MVQAENRKTTGATRERCHVDKQVSAAVIDWDECSSATTTTKSGSAPKHLDVEGTSFATLEFVGNNDIDADWIPPSLESPVFGPSTEVGPSASTLADVFVSPEASKRLVRLPNIPSLSLDESCNPLVTPERPSIRGNCDPTLALQDTLQKHPSPQDFSAALGNLALRMRQSEWSRQQIDAFTQKTLHRHNLDSKLIDSRKQVREIIQMELDSSTKPIAETRTRPKLERRHSSQMSLMNSSQMSLVSSDVFLEVFNDESTPNTNVVAGLDEPIHCQEINMSDQSFSSKRRRKSALL